MPRPKRTKVAPSVLGRPAVTKTKQLVPKTPPTSKAGTKATRRSLRSEETTARTRASSRIEHAEDAVDGPEDEPEEDEPEVLPSIEVDRSSSPEVEMGRRESFTPNAAAQVRRSTRKSLVAEPELPKHKPEAVPPMQNSILGAGRMRRRPRQPSILGSSRARSSSAGLESDVGSAAATPGSAMSTLRTGTLRRRPRQPSIIGSAQRPRRDELLPARDDSDEDENDFNPVEVESTPVERAQHSQSTPSSSNSRKRKLAAVQVPCSQVSPTQSAPDTPSPPVDERIASSLSSSLSRPPSSRLQTPEPREEDVEPPMSTSSEASTPRSLPGQRQNPRRATRGVIVATQDSPLSSPPSLTHSPNDRFTRGRTARAESPTPQLFSTAQLQALLPKRRPRRRRASNAFSIASSDDESDHVDEDASRPRSRSIRPLEPQHQANRPVSRAGKAPARDAQPKTRRRTYGRDASTNSDKENAAQSESSHAAADASASVSADGEAEADSLGPLPDSDPPTENSQELEQRLGKELKNAVRRFAEIDRWELDFEEVSGESSSQRDAR